MPNDRIVELRHVRAGDLAPHPLNWRRHTAEQVASVKAMLDRLGYVAALVAVETDEGLQLIDGHLRAELSPDEEVPVLVTDLTELEARTALATLDPIRDMAAYDAEKAGELREYLDTEVDGLIDRVLALDDRIQQEADRGLPDVKLVDGHTCPHCGHEW